MDGRFDPCFVYSWFKVIWEPSHARGICSGSCLKVYPFMGEFSTVLPDLCKYRTLRDHHIFKEGIWLYRYRSPSERQHSGAVKGVNSGARLPGSDYSSSTYQLSNCKMTSSFHVSVLYMSNQDISTS